MTDSKTKTTTGACRLQGEQAGCTNKRRLTQTYAVAVGDTRDDGVWDSCADSYAVRRAIGPVLCALACLEGMFGC